MRGDGYVSFPDLLRDRRSKATLQIDAPYPCAPPVAHCQQVIKRYMLGYEKVVLKCEEIDKI